MRTTLVIPCFNEEHRLQAGEMLRLLAEAPGLQLLFVNDGSSDGTGRVLAAVAEQSPARIRVLELERNSGKAEAVRLGLQEAVKQSGAVDAVGYADADLATPVEELGRLARLLRECEADVLIGSRVALLGRHIERRPMRHYLGRVFATAASLILRMPVYDTQCGAKFFRVTPALSRAISEPFVSRWVFDVELLGRLVAGASPAECVPVSRVREEPLFSWRDIPGSKLKSSHMIIAAADLLRIWRDLGVRRRLA